MRSKALPSPLLHTPLEKGILLMFLVIVIPFICLTCTLGRIIYALRDIFYGFYKDFVTLPDDIWRDLTVKCPRSEKDKPDIFPPGVGVP